MGDYGDRPPLYYLLSGRRRRSYGALLLGYLYPLLVHLLQLLADAL
jgi:hypothetical protein